MSNTLENYCWFLGFILFGLIFKRIISKYLSHIIYRIVNRDASINVTTFDEILIKPIGFFVFLLFIYLGSLNIDFPNEFNFQNANLSLSAIFKKAFTIVVLFAVGRIALRLVEYFGIVFKNRANTTESKMDDQLVPFVVEIGKIACLLKSLIESQTLDHFQTTLEIVLTTGHKLDWLETYYHHQKNPLYRV